MSTATKTSTSDDGDDRDVTAADAEITETRSKIDQLMSLLPGLEARRADAADRKRREAVTALREQIEPTVGAEVDQLRAAVRAVEQAIADLIKIVARYNTRLESQAAAMIELGVPRHPQGLAPMPSPEAAGLGYSRAGGELSVVVDLHHERTVQAARLVDQAVEAGKRVADGADQDAFESIDRLITTVQPKTSRYFVTAVDLASAGRRNVQHQIHAFDAAQVDRWERYEHDRFVAEITEDQAWRIGWGLARIEPRTAGGVEVTSVDPGR